MRSLTTIEHIKLFATACNTAAVSVLTVGVFTPAAIIIYGLGNQPANRDILVYLLLTCVCLAVALHLIGQWALELLEDKDE